MTRTLAKRNLSFLLLTTLTQNVWVLYTQQFLYYLPGVSTGPTGERLRPTRPSPLRRPVTGLGSWCSCRSDWEGRGPMTPFSGFMTW